MSKDKKVRFGVQVQTGPISHVIQQSVSCENNGLDSIWYPDHFIGGHPSLLWLDPFITVGLMGASTSRAIVGVAATETVRREPATVAQSVATLDHVTKGRTAVVVGAGEAMNLVPFGISIDNLYGKLYEGIRIIKMLWAADSKKPANFQGKFYRLNKAFLQIQLSTKPHPPIYVGAFGEKMLQLTGELADGWMPFSHTPASYKKCLYGPIKQAAEKAGRSLSDIEPAMLPVTAISMDSDQAREEVERSAKRFLVMLPSILKLVAPNIQHPGKPYTLVNWMGHLRKEDMDIISRTAESIPSELALKTVIYGTPDECIDQVEDFIEAGCRHFVFGLRGKDLEESIRLLGKVASYFREEQN